jgi:hypothetical protein
MRKACDLNKSYISVTVNASQILEHELARATDFPEKIRTTFLE